MIGTVVGNYKITDKLGEGGMGAVFKGVDLMLEREVAIKVLRPEFSSQPQLVERFRAEAVTLAKLNHPNVATLHGFFRQGSDFFMIMEFLRGETIDSVILRTGAMPLEQAVRLFCQALEGIGHAHSMGIIHRDIKPANMMVTQKGTIKVMDFGIARVLGTARMTREGSIVGTIAYMSPEQIRGEESDARADIYSLGILLYEMLTGRIPFVGDTEFKLMMAQIEEPPPPPRTFAPHISVSVEQAIMRALAKRPEARFQTVEEFRTALESAMGTAATQVVATPPKPVVPATRLGQMPTASPSSGETVKATRLGSDLAPAPAQYGQMQETRLGQTPGAEGRYPQVSYPGYAPTAPGQFAPAAAQTSFFSKLNWMHYTAAALGLALLLMTPFILMGILKKRVAPSNPPVTNQPATTTNPTAGTNATPGQNQPATQPATAPEASRPAGAQNVPSQTAPPIVTAGEQDKTDKTDKSERAGRRDSDAAARERARRRAEAKRLLDQ
jgi:serine/threonine protein kinase